MWLTIPSTCCPSAREPEDSISASHWRSRLLERSVGLNGTPMPVRYWLRGWRRAPWIRRLFGLICEPSMADRGVESWIASLRDSRANPSAPLANDAAPPMPGGSGPTSRASFGRLSQDGSSWRTYPDLFGTDFPLSSKTWTPSGSWARGALYRQPPLERRINATGSGFWPTPDALATTRSNRSNSPGAATRPALAALAPMWPTPLHSEARQGFQDRSPGKKGSQESLSTIAVKNAAPNWPTPMASDGNRESVTMQRGNPTLAGAAKWATPRAMDSHSTGGNPSMGYGETLTDQAVRNPLWPTPSASDGVGSRTLPPGTSATGVTPDGKKKHVGIQNAAMQWPTPAASDHKRGISPDERDRPEGATLSATVSHFSPPVQPTTTGGGKYLQSTRVLNPRFVEALMGWPIGLTSCELPVMELSRWLRRWRSYVSSIV